MPQAQPQTPPPGGGAQQGSRPLKVLVVDNNRPNRASTEALLSSCGFAVRWCFAEAEVVTQLQVPSRFALTLVASAPHR